jgi:hypothetical protein
MLDLAQLLSDHQMNHSEFQMDNFITVRSGGTLYGCYKQALRELWKRYRGLTGLYWERATIAAEAEATPSKADHRLIQLDNAKQRLRTEELDKSIADTEREFLHFYGQATALREALGISDETPLTSERRATLDAEMWEHHLRSKLACEIMAHGSPSVATLEMLQSFPREMRRQIVQQLQSEPGRKALLDWFLDYSPQLPAPRIPSGTESRRLLECCASSRFPTLSLISCETGVASSQRNSTPNACESAKPVAAAPA